MKRTVPAPSSRRKRMVVAVVLGAALSAMSPARGSASDVRDATLKAVTAIDRYCTVCWRNAHLDPSYWPDCTQEVFCRLLERISPDAWGRVLTDEAEERREFFRAIDTVKKRSQRSRKFVSGAVETLADDRHSDESRLADDREVVRHAAAEMLSPRQQRILQLSMQGAGVHEIATELDLAPERVSDEKYKAIHKLRNRLSRTPV